MATPWTILRALGGAANNTAAVLATGPSLTRVVADAVVAAFPTIAVNNAFELAPNATMLYACDSKFWLHYTDALKFKGVKVTLDESLPNKRVLLLRDLGRSGFAADDLTGIHNGLNSGYQAVQIALKAGAHRVLLFGFDMHGDHFFGKHPSHLQDPDPNVLNRFISEFEKIAPLYERMGFDIVNCTPGSALTCFRSSTLEDEMSNPSKKERQLADGEEEAQSDQPIDASTDEQAAYDAAEDAKFERINRVLALGK